MFDISDPCTRVRYWLSQTDKKESCALASAAFLFAIAVWRLAALPAVALTIAAREFPNNSLDDLHACKALAGLTRTVNHHTVTTCPWSSVTAPRVHG